jgi:hypothetical protein
MTLLGQIGLGLMWGWFFGNYWRAWEKRPFLLTTIFILITLLQTWQIYSFITPALPFPYLLTIPFALIIHINWQQKKTPHNSSK